MKRRIRMIALLAMLILTLAACEKTEFSVIESEGKRMTITAVKARRDAAFTAGTLEVAEGEMVAISSDLTKGTVRVEIIEAARDGNGSFSQLGDVIITGDFSRTDGASGTVEAGKYLLRATCLEPATGTLRIEVKPAA